MFCALIMLSVIITILTVILVFICLLMSLVILMQRPKQEGLGAAFGGGIADKMLGSGTTDFLQRATVMMGVAFFVLSLTIATLMAYDRQGDRDARADAVKDAAGELDGDTDKNPDQIGAPPVGGDPEVPPVGGDAEIAIPEVEEEAAEIAIPEVEAEVPAEVEVPDPATTPGGN